MYKQLILLLTISLSCNSFMEAKTLYDFSDKSSLRYWSVIDDGVMGGNSKGALRINYEGHGVFTGYVSLENYGGFSSIRYRPRNITIKDFKYISIRLFGDDKYYQLRIKADYYDRHVYVKQFFALSKWQEIIIPLKEMEPSFRGRKLNMDYFNDNSIVEIGFLIGNKVEEDFTLIIDKISLK